jgi:hypothetical protein
MEVAASGLSPFGMTESTKSGPEQKRTAQDLRQLIRGFQLSQAIHVAAVLKVADQLTAEGRTSDEIAEAIGAHPGALYRLLRALAAADLLREGEGRRFTLTAMGRCLRSDAPGSLGPWAVWIGQAAQWQAWGRLLHSIKSGENAFRSLHGMDAWTYRERHPEQAALFHAAMTGNSRLVEDAIVAAGDFGRFASVVDIGGGQGALLAAILAATHGIRGVLFDRPHVLAAAAPLLAEAGVAQRCEIQSGDMFEAVPAGCDAYLLKHILHDWDDERCVRILQNCRRAMAPGAQLFVIERLLGAPNQGLDGKLSDLAMLVGPGGRERTADEFVSLLRAAGLRLADVIETKSHLTLLVGQPA